jgi:hypothetical protein
MGSNKNRSGSLLSFLIWLLLLSITLVMEARGEDRALIIGVGRYAHFSERLNGVSTDVSMMAEVAQMMGYKPHQIKILEHEKASSASVNEAFDNWLIRGAGPEDRVFFYFSGHGSQVPDEDNDEKDQFDEVLLLHDTAIDDSRGQKTLTGVLIDDDFNNMLAKIESHNILVILDACHSGSATRSLHLTSRSFPVNQAKVKYFYYSPMLEAAGGKGSFDVMKAKTTSADKNRYVAITACRDDEKTVATSHGSIFTLGLRQIMRDAAASGISITPEELKIGATQFIRNQIRSPDGFFHPQIAGDMQLRRRPIFLASTAKENGATRNMLENLNYKSNEIVWLKLNKSCFETGDVMQISVWSPEPGYLTIIGIAADDHATVLFPNQYHPDNAVGRGKTTIPSSYMHFEMVVDGSLRPSIIRAFLSASPINVDQNGFRNPRNMFAILSPNSTRSLILRQRDRWLASGSVTAEIRSNGMCQ